MKYIPVLFLSFALSGAAALAQGQSAPWVLKPGVVTRGERPSTWTLDLRNKTAARAADEAVRLSNRLYGPRQGDLSQPLVLQTDFPAPKVLAFELSAISMGGGDLTIRTNGQLVHRQRWPAARSTHRPQRLCYIPLPAGPVTVRFECTHPGGVVVIDRYLIADTPAQLPSQPPALPFASLKVTDGGPAIQTDFKGDPSRPDDGYRGIWFTLGQFSEYGDKYSGGLGTYTANHLPLAVYAPQVDKTFFVYGGTRKDKRHLLIMASYYDHAKNVVPRPTIVHDKQGVNDPHDNPSMNLDDQGYIWVFISGRGRVRPGFKYRSVRPYDVSEFTLIRQEEFTYPQPWFVPGRGFFHLFTKYTGVRELYWETSPDGVTWTDDQKLAGLGGHYQISGEYQGKIGTFFNRHPGGSVDKRTDLYYLQTTDWGRTWTTVDGRPVPVPLTNDDNPARVIEYSAQKKLMYTIDLNFDLQGHPVLLYIVSPGYQAGPANNPREWTLTKWTGQQWETHVVCRSDHNYDLGSLFISDREWKIIGPTEVGPQPFGTGGEVAGWVSRDTGRTWTKQRQVTRNSEFNHTFVRRPLHAKDPFYVFWADGHPHQPSISRLYFCNAEGSRVWRLPFDMLEDFASPEEITPR